MKKLISMTIALGLLACAKAPQSGQTASASAIAGIIGGTAVAANDPIAHTTVQVYMLITEVDPQTNRQVTELASCTGSLVSDDVILTAGHCAVADPSDMFIYFSKDIPSDMKSFVQGRQNNPLVRQVVGGLTNPAWAKLTAKKTKNWGDMSLLKFEGSAPSGYSTATLISADAKLANNESILLAGYGLVQPLLDENNQAEATELREVTVSIKDANFSQTEIMLATDQGKGSCHGDSGGPGFVTVNGQQVVAAITSRADTKTDPQGQCVGDTIYTDVAPYLGWISQTVSYLDSASFQPAPIAQPGSGKPKQHKRKVI